MAADLEDVLLRVAALREDKTLNQLSSEFGVHPVVISNWKKQALLALPGPCLVKIGPF